MFKFFWIFGFVVSIANAFIFNERSKKYIAQNPELKEGYTKLIKWFLIFFNIPFMIIGIGELSEMTHGIQMYLALPKSLNPILLIFHLYMFLFIVFSSIWIYARGGADFIAKHPGIIAFRGLGSDNDITSALTIKIIWTAVIIFNTIFFILRSR